MTATPSVSRGPSRSVTIKDVAARAGVHFNSVSVALNGARNGTVVSEATRERILQAAEELGYKRNGVAAAARSGKFGSIALLMSQSSEASTLPQGVLRGIVEELREYDQHISLFTLPDEELTDATTMPKVLREWMADGMIIDYTHHIPSGLIEIIQNHRLPAVWLNADRDHDCVRPDDFGAGVLAAQHLLELGHRHLGFAAHLSGPARPEAHYSHFARRDGVKKAVEEAGARFTEMEGFLALGSNYHQQVEARRAFLRSPDRPTAIISYSRPLITLRAAELENIEVPRDLSVVTFGSQPGVTAGEELQLDTVTLDEREIGRRVARMIQEKIKDPQMKLALYEVPCGFAPGESTRRIAG